MATIYYNIQGSFNGGGPSVHVARMAGELTKAGHKVIYSNPEKADVAICIINTGKILRQVDRNKTKVILRIDGIYDKLYNEKFNRKIRPDMTALHEELKRDIPKVDCVVYQSEWSKERIWDEIVRSEKNCTVINNGVNIRSFTPRPEAYKNDGFVKLCHVGFMRDAYLMEMLIGTYKAMKERGCKVKLLLCGKMDGGCTKVFNANRDSNIIYHPHVKNTQLASKYSEGDIYLDVRQGSSCNNTVAEAQACGIPIITSSWGGSSEMIVNRKTGIVVDGGKWDYNEKYIQNICNAIEEIIPDLQLYKKSSRLHAENNLSAELMAKKYLKAMGL